MVPLAYFLLVTTTFQVVKGLSISSPTTNVYVNIPFSVSISVAGGDCTIGTDNVELFIAGTSVGTQLSSASTTFSGNLRTALGTIGIYATCGISGPSPTVTVNVLRANLCITVTPSGGSSPYPSSTTFGINVQVCGASISEVPTSLSPVYSIQLSTSPGGEFTSYSSSTTAGGLASFSGVQILTSGTFNFVASSTDGTLVTFGASSAYTIQNNMAYMTLTPSATSIATGVTFSVTIAPYAEDDVIYSGTCSISITEEDGTAISGSSTVTTCSGSTVSITGLSFSSSGVKTLKVTDSTSSSTGSSTIRVTGSYSLTLDYVGFLVVKHLITFTAQLFDDTNKPVLSSTTVTLAGATLQAGSLSSTSSTSIFTFTGYFTGLNSQSVTATHASSGATQGLTLTIQKNTAVINPIKDWAKVPDTLTYTVHLQYAIQVNEVITITSSNAVLTLSAASLTFTSGNYASDQTVTVTISSSASAGTLTVTHANSDLDFTSPCHCVASGVFSLTVYSTIDVYFLLSGSPVMMEGGTDTYTIVLPSVPTADVILNLASSSAVTLSPTSVTFTTANYMNPRTITVTSVISSLNQGGGNSYIITHTVSTSDPFYQSASTLPASFKAYVIKISSPSVLISEDVVFQESQGGTYYIVLTSKPTSDVTVVLTAGGSTISVSPSTLVFTSGTYSTPQAVTLASVPGTTARYLKYSITVSHSVISSDPNYSGITPMPAGTITVTAVHPCRAGMYAWPPGSGTCTPCPLGYKCTVLYEEKVACTTGYFSPLGVSVCIPCMPDHSCPGNTMPVPCPDGTNSAWSVGVCSTCTGGNCGKHGAALLAAPVGFYVLNNGHSLYQCPPGYSCAGGTSAPVACAAGYYAPIGSSSCTQCPAGTYCHDPATPIPTLCSWYSYSTAGSTKCTYCEVGYSCSTSLNTKTACTGTQVSLEGWLQCLESDAMKVGGVLVGCGMGYYMESTTCTICPVGFECDGFFRKPCPPGWISASTGASGCTQCLYGTYTNQIAQTACTSAPAGSIVNMYYIGAQPCWRGTTPDASNFACIPCPVGSQCDTPSTPTACVAGNFCSPIGLFQSGANPQQPCPSGYYYNLAGGTSLSQCIACPAGKYCAKGSATTGSTCPVGHYCPAYSYIPENFPCPIGTYNSNTGSTSIAACTDCPVGYYCRQGSSKEYDCTNGYYCPLNSYYPYWCPAGKTSPAHSDAVGDCVDCAAGEFCPSGSYAWKCPPGTYNPTAGQGLLWDACQTCQVGYSCSEYGQSDDTVIPCKSGHYCPLGTEFQEQFPCPAGTFTDSAALADHTGCDPCPAGFYCNIRSTSADQVKCPRGHYCTGSVTFSHYSPCAAGTYSWALGNTLSTNCADCPVGRYCRRGASYASGYCAPGYYCPAGTARPDMNPCPVGTYMPYYNATDTTECISCPAGYFCLAGTVKPMPCPPGSYASTVGTTVATCTPCAAGKYCPTASTAETVCPDGSYADAGATVCFTCPGGFYCAGGAKTPCPTGSYCPTGASTATACPVGYYCPASSTTATPCQPGTSNSAPSTSVACSSVPAGYYSVIGSSSSTGKCEPGYYCPAGSKGPYDTPCPAGTYNYVPGGSSLASCLACPAGYYCKLGTANPVICPVGTYCVASSSSPTYCPAGTIGLTAGLTASASCSSCPAGSVCTQPGLLVSDGSCALGQICAAGSTSSSGTSTCPAGGYCQPGFPSTRACPPGTYNPNTGAKDVTKCGKCNAGYYCTGSETAANVNACEAGYYCPVSSYWRQMAITPRGYYSGAASSAPTICAIGTFNRLYYQSSCSTCTAGFYCDSTGMTEPVICPVGEYCVTGVSAYTDCPVGTFNPREGLTQLSDCLPCPPGRYCGTAGIDVSSGDCDPGYYCKFGSTTNKPVTGSSVSGVFGQCPTGYFCIQASPLAVPCPTGTYLNTNLGTALSSCLPCTPGSYCTNAGLSAVQGSCAAGYYCSKVTGTTVPRPTEDGADKNYCDYGEYCVAGSSAATQCPGGTYQDSLRQSACIQCPAGYYCPQGTGLFDALLCPIGFYCPAGTTFINENPCPQGTYNPRLGITDVSQCLPCPPGYYCSTSGKSIIDTVNDKCDPGYFCKQGSKLKAPIADYPGDNNGGRCVSGYYCPAGSAFALDCDAGSYCNANILAAPVGLCTAGYYCIGKSASPTPTDGTTGNICPKGHYCLAGSKSPTPCPKGTYNSLKGKTLLTDCLSCPIGKYCGGVGLTTFSGACAAGYFCAGGNYEYRPLAGKCTAGNYCPAGTSAEQPCATGYYQDRTLQSSCKVCPAGYYCPNAAMTTPTLCEAGYYCPLGSASHLACPSGTYSSVQGRININQCTNCPPGKYCSGGASAPTNDCSAGYFCLGSATGPSPTEDAQGGRCPKGYYCPAGSTSAIPCTPGFYCGTTLLSAPSGPCTAGYYCMEGASLANPRDRVTGAICPQGYYCPAGSAAPTPCPIGTYQPSQGKTLSTECLTCSGGYYCSSTALNSLSGQCAQGYFCPAGSILQKNPANICPIGFYCPQGKSAAIKCADGTYQDQIGQATCKTCPAAFYCDTGATVGATSPTVCPIGYICPAGTSSLTKIECNSGNYNPFLGQSVCVICPAGYYCPSTAGGVITPTICPIKSYCVEGTNVPSSCPPGTYTDQTGLQTKDQCKQCPAGYYCLNGEIMNQCSPGYYCVSGSNTATPDSYTNTGTGSPCPVGHYCLIGTLIPTPCPSGKFRVQTGGQSVNDCSYCEAGYYCIPNDPVPKACPTGAYCPAGSSTPLLCGAGNYSSATQASAASVCVKCPAGYICNRAGIGNYTNFPCMPGYYCPAGAQLPIVSPKGYYSPGYSAGSVSDLNGCPGGFSCDEMSTGYTMCGIGTYCIANQSAPTPCPQGAFCDYQSSTYTPCPVGFYCQKYSYPMQEYPPLLCPEGSICPAGSVVPQYCSAGKKALMARNISNTYSYCGGCPAGTYSYVGSTSCSYCDPGYVSLGNATIPTPTDIELYSGYQCGPGYYCPSGSTTPIPCPPGTFSKNQTLGSVYECSYCPANTYSDLSASTSCQNCSSSARSDLGSLYCDCIGAKRVYLKAQGICVCQAGYEYISSSGNDLSDEDGTEDCLQIVYSRCATGEVRDELGNCRSSTDCSSSCNSGSGDAATGERPFSTGLCMCDNVESADTKCGQSCRNESIYYKTDINGNLIEVDPTTGSQTIVNQANIEGYSGSVTCDPSTSSCKVYSVSYDGSSFQGVYGASSNFPNKRRRLSTAVTITNPVFCLSVGESMMFSVQTPDHFPIYLKDSLLNSNKNFDYSPFTFLKNNITNGTDIKVFAYTFNDPGIYLFADNADTDQQIVIGVMSKDQQCPFSGANIQSRMTSSLHLLGAKLDTSIVLTVDWTVVYGVMGFLVLSIAIFSGVFYYYTLITWSVPPMKRIPYREENLRLYVKGDEGTRTTMKMVVEGKEASSSGSEAEEIREMIFEKVPDQAAYEAPEVPDDKAIIDSALLQAIKDKIRDNNSLFLSFLDQNEQDALDRMKRLEEETADLKNLLHSLLNPIKYLSGKVLTIMPKESMSSENFYPGGGTQSNVDYQEALNEIADNSELLEQDKQKLMNELNSELNKLDQNLKLEKTKHDAELGKRLADRARRRKELERTKQELEIEEKQVIKRQQAEIRMINAEIEADEEELTAELNEDKMDMARKLHGQKAIELQNRLREGLAIHPEKQQELARQYEQEIQALDKNLTMNQIKQQQELAKRIEEKKRQRKAMLKEKERKNQIELEESHKQELLGIRQRKIEIEAQEIVGSVMPVFVESSEDSELKSLENKQKEELLQAEKAIKESEEQEASKVLRNASLNEAKLAQQKAALEKQKQQLMQSVATATEEEREELIRDLAKTDAKLREIAEEQSMEQKKNIDTRLEMRRKRREEKLKELKDKQEAEKRLAEQALKEKQNNERALSLEEAIKNALSKLPEDQQSAAIRQMLEEKHENERVELQKKLKRKLRDRQRNAIQEVMRNKANDLELLRNEYRDKLKATGRDAETSARIQKEEAEAINKLDYYYMKNLETLQEEAWRDQQKKNQDELLALIDVQLGEMRKHMRKQDPNSQGFVDRLKKEREDIEREGREKLETLARQKAELELLKAQKQKELEEMIMKEKQREEKERFLKDVMDKKRAMMERQKKERDELLKRGQLTKEQMERLIAEHQRELNALEMAIARERERQIAIMSQKIAEKKARKRDYEASMLRMKEEQDRWQKELEELPGISNKQATTLLLKWRRYPKKSLKDIEKSVKVNEPAQKLLPVVNKQQVVKSQKVENKRLEELLWRVEKIESTVDHVNTEHVQNIMNSIKTIENRVKSLKK